MAWIEAIFNFNVQTFQKLSAKCLLIKCKQKLLVPKCDSFDKHVEKNEGIKVMDMKCVHVKNETTFVSINHPFVLAQV
jgi:hypothetical protein